MTFISNGRKTVLNNLFGGGINIFLNIIIGITLLPIYLKSIDDVILGIWFATGNIIVMLSSFESGVSFLTTQKLITFYRNKNRNEFSLVLTSSLIIISAICFFLLCIILILSINFHNFFDVVDAQIDLINKSLFCASVGMCVSLFTSILGVIPQTFQSTKEIQIIRTLGNLVFFVSNIVLLKHDYSILAIALSIFFRELFIFLGFLYYFISLLKKYKFLKFKFSFRNCLEFFKEIRYQFIGRLSQNILFKSDAFLIATFINPVATTYYEVTSRIVIMFSSFVNVLTNSIFSSLSTLFKKDIKRFKIKSISITALTFKIISTGIIFIFFTNEPLLEIWLNEEYFAGFKILFFILLFRGLHLIFKYLNNLLVLGDDFKISGKSIFLGLFVFILLFSFFFFSGIDFKLIHFPILLTFSIILSILYMLKSSAFFVIQSSISNEILFKIIMFNLLQILGSYIIKLFFYSNSLYVLMIIIFTLLMSCLSLYTVRVIFKNILND